MSTVLTAICAGVVMGCAGSQEKPSGDVELWSEIRSLLESSGSTRDPRLVEYLKSLTPEQTLAAARQACKEPASDVRLLSDELRFQAAVESTLVCLEYYFDNSNVEEAGRMLMERAADPREHAGLRLPIVACTTGFSRHRFGKDLRAYTLTHWREVEALLTKMLKAGERNTELRVRTIGSLTGVICDQLWAVCQSDPNVRRALEERPKRGAELFRVMTAMKSGDVVELDQRTWDTLKPVLLKMDENIRLMSSIALDIDNEPEAVREQARRSLKRYRTLPMLDLGDEIDKALQDVTD